MLFCSLTFIFIFLPLTLFLYYVVPKKHVNIRNFILLIMSLFFYSWGEPKYIFLMLISIIFNYFIGLFIDKFKKYKKLILLLGVTINIVLLIYFKYLGLFVNTFNNIFNQSINVPQIILPIGISFYSFQILSYIIDVYRGTTKVQKNIFTLATYISLFPQLIAGPIVRYETVEKELQQRNENLDNFCNGLRRFVIGFAKKIIIANNAALFVDSVFAKEITGIGTIIMWLTLVAYAIQIYFDFSGYSDMAIGLGKMFGFNFLENFNYPYIAETITDFWRRWHISLSSWFKDYVYIPLGGNRVSLIKNLRNIFIVWLLTGLWHGASWNFLVWGLYYGVILILEKTILKKVLEKTPKVIKHIYSIILILVGWMLFRCESFSLILSCIKELFIYSPSDISLLFLHYQGLIPSIPYIIIGIILSTPLINKVANKLRDSENLFLKMSYDVIIFALFILALIYLVNSSYNPFIYFQF